MNRKRKYRCWLLVFLALDLTEPVLDEAVAAGADMILTHHPMIFSGIKKINNHTFTGRKILRLIKEDIRICHAYQL